MHVQHKPAWRLVHSSPPRFCPVPGLLQVETCSGACEMLRLGGSSKERWDSFGMHKSQVSAALLLWKYAEARPSAEQPGDKRWNC